MKIDQRRYNDNSREWHHEMLEKRKEALFKTCQKILSKNEPRTFTHIANLMKLSFEKNVSLSAQTISQNSIYRDIFNNFFDNELMNSSEKKFNPKSNVELQHELHQLKTKNIILKREIKLLRHHIQKSNLNIDSNQDISYTTINETAIALSKQLIQELTILGDFYWDNVGLKRERDGKLFITNESASLLEIK